MTLPSHPVLLPLTMAGRTPSVSLSSAKESAATPTSPTSTAFFAEHRASSASSSSSQGLATVVEEDPHSSARSAASPSLSPPTSPTDTAHDASLFSSAASARFGRSSSSASKTLTVSSSTTSSGGIGSSGLHANAAGHARRASSNGVYRFSSQSQRPAGTSIGGIRKKIVVLGDGAIGKTCLLAYFSTGVFPEKYVPTVFENVMFNLEVEGRPVELAVWDTAGQDDYARLRPLAYPDTDAFMLCYAIDQPDTFKNVEANWLPEIRHHCPYAPVLLVGLKADLRNSFSVRNKCVPYAQAQHLVEQGAVAKYKECSALHGDGIIDAMDAAARLALMPRRRRKRVSAQGCLLL